MQKHFIIRFLQNNIFILVLLFVLSFIIYGNSLVNEFAVVDDLDGFINSQVIRDIGASIKTFNIQVITYSLSYAMFGVNALPLRILALVNHAIVGFLLYITMRFVFNKKVGLIAAVLFIAHPVTSESVNWVSAQFYIVMAIFFYSAIVIHILYRKTNQKKFLFFTAVIITLEFLLIKHPWVLVVPAAIVVIDFFLVKKWFDFKFYALFATFLSPILIIFIFINLPSSVNDRQLLRQATKGGTLANQQLLQPVYEGYPYSVFTLSRLYTFPKDLTMYYDGNPVTKTNLNYMRAVLALYIVSIVFFLFKDRRISGLLILLLLLVAPVFVPQKITWYMTERYLYAGTGFFTTLLALMIIFIEKKLRPITDWKYFSVMATGILLLLYSIRTIVRNSEWKTPETIAKATIKTSPYTVRPYNDVGGYYIMQKRIVDAKNSYVQALEVGPSATAIKNLGYIYFQYGFDPDIKTINIPYEEIVTQGIRSQQMQDYDKAMYYFNEAYAQNPSDIRVLNSLAIMYTDSGAYKKASEVLQKSLSISSTNADTYYVMGYKAFKEGNTAQAVKNLQEALQYNPGHQSAKTNLDFLLKQN